MIQHMYKLHLVEGQTVEVPYIGQITVPTSGPYTITVYDDSGVTVCQDWDNEVLEWEVEEIDGCDEDFMRSISS